jgi:hypothetical protein
MSLYGSIGVFYAEDGKSIDELPDGPVFNTLVLDGAIEDHIAKFLDANFPDVEYSNMQFEVEQYGDSIIGFEYTGDKRPAPMIQIPPLTVHIDGHEYDVEFSDMEFTQSGGKRLSRRRRVAKRKTRKSTRSRKSTAVRRRKSTRRARRASRKYRR